jgi:hypothetical protein
MAALSGIATFCRDQSVPFVTFVFNWTTGADPLRLRSEIAALGEKHGFPVVNVESWWGSVDLRTITNSVVDVHPNSRGHEILAAGMAETLKTHRLTSAR